MDGPMMASVVETLKTALHITGSFRMESTSEPLI